MNFPHLLPDRLAGFLLRGVTLSEAEQEHLARCKECVNEMATATMTELDRETARTKNLLSNTGS
jgi:hypothetical protein